MELRHLRYFAMLAEELHFARAADRLGISQPPLSQQIRALEDELGVRLFDRTSRRVALTPAGLLFQPAAQRTLEEARRAMLVARRAADGELGDLRIGFNASAPFVPRVAAAIHDFRQRYPDVGLSLSEFGGPTQVEAVAIGTLDVGFVRSAGAPALPGSLTATVLLEEHLFLGMRPDHRLAAADGVHLSQLAGEPMVIYANDRSGGFTVDLFRLLRRVAVEPTIAQTVHEVSTLLGLAAAGVGVVVITDSLRAIQSAGLTYRPILDEGATSSMWLVTRRSGLAAPCRNFLSLIDPALVPS